MDVNILYGKEARPLSDRKDSGLYLIMAKTNKIVEEGVQTDYTSTPYLKFLCKFSRIFFRVYKFRNGGVAGYVEYSGLVQSGK